MPSVAFFRTVAVTTVMLVQPLLQISAHEPWDLVVYGGSSAAVIAAVQAKRMGKSVVVVSPDRHLGGLSSGGLGMTDTGNKAVIGGLARDFYQRVWKHYERPEAWRWQERSAYGNRGQGHAAYQQGLLWFVANDPRVPKAVQDELRTWGLPKDEFTDNGHWSHQLYIREARRMVGAFVMTENELRKKKPTPDPVGMGSYAIDSHNVQRHVTPEGFVQNEGDIGVSTRGPYEIAYGSIRMEPVFTILAQSAATAAALAIDGGTGVQDVSYDRLRERLLADGQVLAGTEPTAAGTRAR